MSDIGIAETPDLLTPAWLTAALSAGGHIGSARVSEVAHRPLGTGQMCDSFRLTLRYDDPKAAPTTLVAKLPSADATSRGTAIAMRSYEKEVRFYQQLAPSLPIAVPKLYYTDIEPASGSFVLLLEDLAPAEQGDQLAGCSPELAAAALAELVKLHAPRWGDASLAELDWLYGNPAEGIAMMTMMMPVLWTGFQERYGAALEDDVLTAGAALFGNLERYFVPTKAPTTIVHGDFRLDNLLVVPATSRLRGVVDWQTCTVGAGLSDVAYFIGAGLVPEVRREAEPALVRRYHEDLVAAGVRGYEREQCWQDYRRGSFSGLIMAVGASMMVERTARGDQMFLTMASRHSRHILDLDAIDLLAG